MHVSPFRHRVGEFGMTRLDVFFLWRFAVVDSSGRDWSLKDEPRFEPVWPAASPSPLRSETERLIEDLRKEVSTLEQINALEKKWHAGCRKDLAVALKERDAANTLADELGSMLHTEDDQMEELRISVEALASSVLYLRGELRLQKAKTDNVLAEKDELHVALADRNKLDAITNALK